MKDECISLDKPKKWQLKRLVIIHDAIKNGCFRGPHDTLTIEDLRAICYEEAELEASPATIQRDINVLRFCFGVPIDYDSGKKRYYLIDDNYEFAVNSISMQDIFYLSAAKTMLSSFKGSTVYDYISDVIDFVTDTQCRGRSSLLKRIAVPPVPLVAVNDEKMWNLILTAMQENCVIEFDYNGIWNPETTHRRVHPYQIVLDNGRCFLFCYDEKKEEERLFSLSRIKNLTVTDKTFELPEDYEFSSRCGGGRFGAFIGEGPVEFVIDLYGEAREYVKGCVWADNQKLEDFDDEEKTRITFTCTQELPVKEWVLKQGYNAVPVSPDWFVEQWKDDVRGMAERAGLS